MLKSSGDDFNFISDFIASERVEIYEWTKRYGILVYTVINMSYMVFFTIKHSIF